MQAREYDAVVLVHGIGDGERQGDFLVEVTEPLLRWVGENSGAVSSRHAQSVRRGDRPARLEVAGTIPDADAGGATRDFEWHFVEARWSDEFRPPPERTALGWSRYAYPESVLDQLSYYDTVWRFWRLLARIPALGGVFRWWGNGPPQEQDGDSHAWAYRYRIRRSLLYKVVYALWLGVLAPLLILALATPVLLPATPAWLLVRTGSPVERWSTWQRAYLTGLYRLLLTVARLPLLLLGYAVLWLLSALAIVPLAIPGIESARRAITTVVRMRFADVYVYNQQLVQSWAVAGAVERVIAEEAGRCRTLTVIAYSQGAVVAYEALSRMAGPGAPPAATPLVSVREAIEQLDSPLSRPGLELRLITVGGALNRARSHAIGGAGSGPRALLDRPLPSAIRWVDIWAVHDPVPMGSLSAELRARAGVDPREVRVSNTLTELDAHTSYWENDPEVISTIADELTTRPAPSPAAAAEEDGEAPTGPPDWENPATHGFWRWRARNDRTTRVVATRRRKRFLYGLAGLRAAGYLFVAAVLLFTALGGSQADRLIAEADGVRVVQTPMRGFWAPAPEPPPAGAEVIGVAADDSFTVSDGVRGGGAAGAQAWVLNGVGDWLGWESVRYVAFPAIAAVVAAALYLFAFMTVQRVTLAAGRRIWDPPARALTSSDG